MSTEDLLVFNGIDANTGQYLIPPVSQEAISKAALGESWDENQFNELKNRHEKATEKRYALRAGLDAQNLSEAGWGVVFPGGWDLQVQQSVRDALSELLEHRREQAGGLYREFIGPDAPTRIESKDAFLLRFGATPGLVDPTHVPYYLLLVGDPVSMPYQFQFELSVSYAVGRIYFDTLQEYAQYARSVVTAEKGSVSLKRKAVFFGPSSPDDKSTQLSAELLVKPLANYLNGTFADWQVEHILPEDSTKARLSRLLGGEETPALLFTASHGLGYPSGDERQKLYQGALLCQDWPGPREHLGELGRDMFLAAEDIDSQANLLGMVGFHFACYGAGTPEIEHFAIPGVRKAKMLAPRPFLSALPQRMLAHPRGGALAVVGHVDRAWSYSFQWGGEDAQTVTFESLLYKLLKGQTVGSALEDLALRYAEFATMLSSRIYDAEIRKPDTMEMARLWTGHNDARGYALLGDPAVHLPVAAPGVPFQERPAIQEITGIAGRLPEVEFSASQAPVSSQQAPVGYAVPQRPMPSQALAPDDRQNLVKELRDVIDKFSKLSMYTYLVPDGEMVHTTDLLADPPVGGHLAAMTRMEAGKARVVILESDLDSGLLHQHEQFVTATIQAVSEALQSANELVQSLEGLSE